MKKKEAIKIIQKMNSIAINELGNCKNLEESKECSRLINAYATAIVALKKQIKRKEKKKKRLRQTNLNKR